MHRLTPFPLLLTLLLLVSFAGCKDPVAGPSAAGSTTDTPPGTTPTYDPDPIGEWVPGEAPYLSVPDQSIHSVDVSMEYSVDDGATWTQCTATPQDVSLAVGTRVWVRDGGDAGSETFLGEVAATTGPDLYAGDFLYVFGNVIHASPGDRVTLYARMQNIGDSDSVPADQEMHFYLSDDATVTTADMKIIDSEYPYACNVGDVFVGPTTDPAEDPDTNTTFVVPDVPPGTYYIGMHVDATNVIGELNEENNFTPPQAALPIIIKDPTAVAEGAVKVYNSWGSGGGWENKSDGYYWMPYEVLKANTMSVRYYYNNFSTEYEPTALLEFTVDHPRRNECRITVGLGNPDDPYRDKIFQSEWSPTNLLGGAQPFPPNAMAMDVSELAGALNSYDLYLKIENSGSTEATLSSLSLELYADFDAAPMKVLDTLSQALPLTAGPGDTVVYVDTAGRLTLSEREQIVPPSRSVASTGTSFTERLPTSVEVERMIERHGVYEPGRDYNEIIDGKYGTGYAPPTREGWAGTRILESVETENVRGTLPDAVDNSASVHFPPTGNQGSEGSCTAYSFGYYIQTYTEAKERGWDLSGTGWTGTWPGYPDSNTHRIFSPDFIYHQINDGGDNGSNGTAAANLIIRIGGATWATMPYDTADSSSWPSEAAWREAARYRGRDTGAYYGSTTSGYFVIEDDSDIQLLKSLLDAGYIVSTSIDAAMVYDGNGVSTGLDGQDVVDPSTTWASTNHAQTIVGYKEGTAWDPANPDS